MKRILPILSFILFLTIHSQGQDRTDPVQDGKVRIMKLYPNPATSFIKFDFQRGYGIGYNLVVVNFLGKQVQEIKNIGPSTTIELASYARGVYIYQLRDQSGKVAESGKFQVSK